MKLNKSAIALAVCAALGSTGANALTRAQYAALPATSLSFMGGATATDNTLEEAFLSLTGGICASNIDIYRAANQRVITCTVTQASGGAGFPVGGVNVAFHKESAGGSSNGVNPLIDGASHSLQWLNVGELTSDCTVTVVAATANLAGYTNHNNCSLTAGSVWNAADGVRPTGGISDNEPALSAPKPSTAAVAAAMDVTPVFDIVFGVPVTKALYKALQIAQFGDTAACDLNAAPGAYNISDTAGCVPSLTRAQIAALYSQNVADWDSLVRRADGTPLSQIPGVAAPADTIPRICRRVETSGTQAGAEAYFLQQRCVNGGPSFAPPDDASSVTDTAYAASDFANSLVNAAPSSGNMRTCLQAANTLNYWGLGVLSTEVTASNLSGAGDAFRFVGIDGYAPTLANVANGNYTYFTSNVITRTKTASAGANGEARLELIKVLPSKLGNTAILSNLNATFAGRPWGNGGILARQGTATTNTAPYSDAELTASPVNTLSKNGNNCVQPFAVSPTPSL